MKKIFKDSLLYIWQHKPIFLLCIFVFIVTLMKTFPDGGMGCVNGKCGLILGDNNRDGIWFMAVAATAFKTFPFQLPIFSGAALQGYYYFPALIVFLITKLGVPLLLYNYKIFPIIYLFCMMIILVIVGRKILDKPLFVFLLIFFVMLGIPLTIAPALIHNIPLTNKLLINTFQATNIFDSHPTAYSYLMFFPGLLILLKKKRIVKDHIIISILLFFLFGTKFYTAFLYLATVSLTEVIDLIRKKQDIKSTVTHLVLYALFVLASLQVFLDLIHATKGASMFVFSPFATVHHLIEEPSLFYIQNMVLARYYLYQFGMTPRLLGIELFSSILFVVFYFGIRVIGFIYLAKRYITRKATPFEIASGISILVLIAISVLFIQRGDWFNPMQFAVAASHLLSLFAALLCYETFKWNKAVFSVLFVVVIICMIPSNLMNFTYLTSGGRIVISKPEVEALNFLKAQKDGAVFYPLEGPDSPYIPVLTGKVLYYNFTHVLTNFGIDESKRKAQLEDVVKMNVDALDVKYAYLSIHNMQFKLLYSKFKTSQSYKPIFKNSEIALFEKIR